LTIVIYRCYQTRQVLTITNAIDDETASDSRVAALS
jgi:hypothetical protein